MRKRVVIVGAGFAGINVAHGLRKAPVDITIVDRNNFHTFQPLLYQVATGYLGAEEVGTAVRSVFRTQGNLDFRVGEVTGADWKEQRLVLADGTQVRFDYLVVAAGATANFFGIPGMAENAWPLYTMSDALRLRRHLLADLEESVLDHEREPHESTVVVVGGGPTGVEMAGALASMSRDLLGDDAHDLHVVLVEAAPRLLGAFSSKSAKRAFDALTKRRVDVRLNAMVASADPEGITLKDGTRIDSHTIVWGAGVRARGLGERLGLETGKGGGIVVGRDFQVGDKPGVFAVGDIAFVADDPVPLLAPGAIQGGKHVAEQIERLLSEKSTKSFRYRNKGTMAVIGRGDAVAELPGHLAFGGRIAWLLWLGIHVVYLIGFRNRIKVLADWGWNYFTSRGANAIYVEEKPSPPSPH